MENARSQNSSHSKLTGISYRSKSEFESENLSETELNVILKNYEMCQQSAEHHDLIIWTSASILLVATAGLLGSIAEVIGTNEHNRIIVVLCLVGILFCVGSMIFQNILRIIRDKKYAFCQDIEKRLRLNGKMIVRNHLNLKTSASICCFEIKNGDVFNIIFIVLILIFIILLIGI